MKDFASGCAGRKDLVYDVIVAGGGAAGVGAALAASRRSRVLLVETESTVGGDLLTGMPIYGAWNSLGEQCVGGVLNDLMAECRQQPDGFIGPVCDWRTVYGLCLSPAALHLAILRLLHACGAHVMLKSTVTRVGAKDGHVVELEVASQDGLHRIQGAGVVDATGSGRVTELAGGQVEGPGSQETPQPMSLLFRMAGVSFEEFLRFVKENPAEFLLAENPVYGVTPPEAAQRVHDGGLPYAALSAGGALLGGAIAGGRVQPCTAFFITPTSRQRREVCINATRISSAGLLDARETSCLLLDLAEQVRQSVAFLRASVPGFSGACLSSVAHRMGVRETKRIRGDESLTESHVLNAVKSSEGIAKGAHHVDIHGSGTKQIRKPVHGGGTYDIPFGSLIPKGLRNVIAAGRCISSDRSANGSLRLMGTCMATGQAAGTMASLLAEARAENGDVRDLSVTRVREVLRQDGAILDGTQ